MFEGKRIHFIGIGGCGMRALAAMLIKKGAIVSGSDAVSSGYLATLNKMGANCWVGHSAEKLDFPVDLAVVSAAVDRSNPELVALRSRNVSILKYAQMLGLLMESGFGIAVSGTHGKSTTTAMIAYILKEAGFDPSYVVGANVDQLAGGSGVGSGRYFVAEACEYDRSFLNLHPSLAVVLNIEEDHLDYYSGLEEIVGAFSDFVSNIRPDGLLLYNSDDDNVRKIIKQDLKSESFAILEGGDWVAERIGLTDIGCYGFDVVYKGELLGRIELKIPGRHNVYNAMAAVAASYHCDVPFERIRLALERFEGAYRRLSLKASAGGITILDDYAHHPSEIRASLEAVRERYLPRRLWCVFQPHQHSRTRFLLEDFARSFEAADYVIVPDIYFVRDSEQEKGLISSADLVERINQNGGRAFYLPKMEQIVEYLKTQLDMGDAVITMGAGDIWKVADELVSWLRRDSS